MNYETEMLLERISESKKKPFYLYVLYKVDSHFPKSALLRGPIVCVANYFKDNSPLSFKVFLI